jgi:hypothetical protein
MTTKKTSRLVVPSRLLTNASFSALSASQSRAEEEGGASGIVVTTD